MVWDELSRAGRGVGGSTIVVVGGMYMCECGAVCVFVSVCGVEGALGPWRVVAGRCSVRPGGGLERLVGPAGVGSPYGVVRPPSCAVRHRVLQPCDVPWAFPLDCRAGPCFWKEMDALCTWSGGSGLLCTRGGKGQGGGLLNRGEHPVTASRST